MLFLKEQEHAIIFNSVDNKVFFNLKVSVPNRPGTNARCDIIFVSSKLFC